MFWSNDGRIVRKNGNFYFTKNGIVRKVGNNLFGPDGSRVIDNGHIVHAKKRQIRINGNIIFTSDGERYVLNGTTLFGPHGEIWRGVSSMDDAKAIVAMRM